MKRFFNIILRAVSDLSFYHNDLPQLQLKTVLLHYCIFALGIGFCVGLRWSVFTQPAVSTSTQTALAELAQQLPTDLTLIWDGTRLTSTPTAFSLEYPAGSSSFVQNNEFPEKFMSVTTDADLNNAALITITSTEVRILQAPQDPYIEQLSTVLGSESQRLTNADIQTNLPKAQEIIGDIFHAMAWAAPIASSILLVIQRLVQASIIALVLRLIGLLAGDKRSFASSYALVLLLFIPAELLFFVTERVFSLGYPSIFSMSVITYYAIIVLTRPQTLQTR